MKISLARALKEKARLIRGLVEIDSKITSSNSTLARNNFKFNIKELFDERIEIVDKIVKIKIAIQKANVKILDKIYNLAELKTFLGVIEEIEINEGFVQSTQYGCDSLTEWHCQYNGKKIEEIRKNTINEIDNIQDELDIYNHKTKIEIDL